MTLIVIFTLCLSPALIAQSSDQILVGSGGGIAHAGSVYLSFSFGEPFSTYTQNKGRWLSEGFQQPEPVEIMTSIEALLPNSSFKLYPNPANTILQVDLKEISSCGQLTIINLLGQTMLRVPITESHTSISISTLQPGLYWARAECDHQIMIIKSFIKL